MKPWFRLIPSLERWRQDRSRVRSAWVTWDPITKKENEITGSACLQASHSRPAWSIEQSSKTAKVTQRNPVIKKQRSSLWPSLAHILETAYPLACSLHMSFMRKVSLVYCLFIDAYQGVFGMTDIQKPSLLLRLVLLMYYAFLALRWLGVPS